jgi:hypothetical protein
MVNILKINYKCEQCNYLCRYESEWKKHCDTELHKTGKRKERIDKKDPYKCVECEYKTKNKTMYKQHILNEHSTIEIRKKEFKFYCELCDFGTFSKDINNNHLNSKKHLKYMNRINK